MDLETASGWLPLSWGAIAISLSLVLVYSFLCVELWSLRWLLIRTRFKGLSIGWIVSVCCEHMIFKKSTCIQILQFMVWYGLGLHGNNKWLLRVCCCHHGCHELKAGTMIVSIMHADRNAVAGSCSDLEYFTGRDFTGRDTFNEISFLQKWHARPTQTDA